MNINYTSDFITLRKSILKYNEIWFEMYFNGRQLQGELIVLADKVKEYLSKVSLDVNDLIFNVNHSITINEKKYQKIDALIKHFGYIEKVNDFRV